MSSNQEDLERINLSVDIDFRGGLTSKGFIKRLTGNDADINRLQLWFRMSKGDAVGRPEYGGVLDFLLGKLMTQVRIKDIEQAIRLGLQEDFPEFSLQDLEVIPFYQERRWRIRMTIINTEENRIFDFNTNLLE
jgi:hypothetical protein